MSDADWFELRLTVSLPERVLRPGSAQDVFLEPLLRACREVAPAGCAIEGDDAPSDGDEPPPSPGTVRIRVYQHIADHQTAAARLQAAAQAYDGAQLELVPLRSDWRERWKRYVRGFDVSPRLAVRPPWELDQPRQPGQVVAVIEPGLAFGTGQHETTRLCLDLLDARARDGRLPRTLLDVGCGTGILSIAGVLLGVERARGIDIDSGAVAVARENAAVNAVAERVELDATPAAEVDETFPLVIANILTPVLEALDEALVRCTAPGGDLVLSGLLTAHGAALQARYEALGMRLSGRYELNGWMRLELVRP